MKKIVLIGLITLIILFSGCIVEEKIEDQKSDIVNEKKILEVNLFTEKDTYELEESFNVTLNIDYDKEPFKAAIIFDSYRKGFSKHYYNGYIEEISSKELDRSRFHAGYPAEKALRISDGISSSSEDYFSDEGTYYISVYVYNCDIISKEGYNCTPSNVFPSTFGLFDKTPEMLIKDKVKSLASDEIQIIAIRGDVECKSDYVCELYEKCEGNKCVLKTCQELGGNVCSNANDCVALMWDASDTEYCCPLKCKSNNE